MADEMACKATREKHCCKIKGEVCQHVIYDYTDENGVFREVACGLRAELGDWDKVLADPRYPKDAWAPGVNCRDWPGIPEKYPCDLCGAGKK